MQTYKFFKQSHWNVDSRVNPHYVNIPNDSVTSAEPVVFDANVPDTVNDEVTTAAEFPASMSHDIENQFLDNIAMLNIKLLGQYLLPSSTIHVIVEEFANVPCLNHKAMKARFSGKLEELKLPADHISHVLNDVLNDLSASDIFAQLHSPRSGILHSEHTRSQFFKRQFNFVNPVQVNLGRNASTMPRCYHYVPIKQPLTALLSNSSV